MAISNKNCYLEMFLSIADELIDNQQVKSRRDFSSKYLNKCSNYLGSLVFQDKRPSVASIWALLTNLHQQRLLPEWQKALSNSLYERVFKE